MRGGGFVKRYMRIDEVAGRFGVTTRTVRRWFLAGNTCLEAFRPAGCIGTRGIRFTIESVEQFERTGLVDPAEIEG